MKTTYKIFLGIAILLMVAGVLCSSKLYYHVMPMTMKKRGLEYDITSKAQTENQFIWFSYRNGRIVLQAHPEFSSILDKFVYMDVNNKSHIVEKKDFALSDTMSGSMLVMAEKKDWDIDGDGQKEKVFVSAKTDTNDTQGWSPYSRVIARKDIPFEVAMSDRTQLMLFRYGEPYRGRITLNSARGTHKVLEVKNGLIPFVDVRDLRKGVVITAKQDDGSCLSGSYICEYHTVFTKEHLVAAMPLWIFLVSVSFGVMGICIVRRKYR